MISTQPQTPGIDLSVIIPCHNVADHLLTVLRSLSVNAGPGIEFILVDDASTDATPELLADAGRRLPGAQVITHPTNRGLAAARNTGIDQARGRYLTFLDGDDYIGSGYLQQLVTAMDELGCDFIRVDHVRFTGTRRSVHHVPFGPRRRVLRPRDGILPDHRRTGVDYPFAWAGAYHRRLIDRQLLHFDPRLHTCEDRPWIWRLHLNAQSCATVGLRGVFYRRNLPGSLSQIADSRQLDFLPAFDRIVADVLADSDADRLLGKAIRSYCAIICHQLARPGYTRELRARLERETARALAQLPEEPLNTVIAALQPERRETIDTVRRAA